MGASKQRVDQCLEKGELLSMLQELRNTKAKTSQPEEDRPATPRMTDAGLLWEGELGGRTSDAGECCALRTRVLLSDAMSGSEIALFGAAAAKEILRRAGLQQLPELEVRGHVLCLSAHVMCGQQS